MAGRQFWSVLVHHQHRAGRTLPWVTHRVDPYGPTYDLDKALEFAAKVALDSPRVRWTLGTTGSASQVRDRIWIITDGDNHRCIVEAVRLQPTNGRVRQAMGTIRTWLGDKPIRPSARRTA